DRDLLYYLAESFRGRLLKELPATREHMSAAGRQTAYRAKALLVQLAEISVEVAQTVIAPDADGNPVLPSWFLVEAA
ncbi:MoxR family ATPase, partial [Streptomyces sp. IpFD-1.1]|nr:MoxR family ATPase [Streptomyces sp. IpFD-1.1]